MIPLTIKSQTQIRQELLSAMATGGLTASATGTINRTVAEVMAGALAEGHFLLGVLLDGFFIEIAAGEFLDARVRDRLPDGRKLGAMATGTVTFARATPAVATINIPSGTTLITADGTVELTTIVAATIPVGGTSASVQVTATAVGVAGNLGTGTSLRVRGIGIQGVETITVASPGLAGGVDRETDEQLRERYLLEVRNPRRSGSVSDYQAWALTVNGVTGATVLPRNRGPGTVDILIMTAGGIPSDQLVADTQTYIDSVRPAVDDALVVKPTAVVVNVTLTVSPANGYTVGGLTAAVETAVQDYINYLAVGADVLVSRIITSVLAVEGVEDCAVTAPAGNVVIQPTEKAVAGSVGVS